jgi:large subunit ribosomal protein L5
VATKKDIETVVENVETAVENVEKEVKKAAKKAAPKAAETAEKAKAAVKKTAKKAAETAEEAKETVKKTTKKAAKSAEETGKAVKKAAEKTAEAVSEAAADTTAKAAKKVASAAGTVKKAAEKAEKKAESAKAVKKTKSAPKASVTPRMKKLFDDEIAPALKEKFGYENVMQIPRLEKVVINMGLGAEKDNPKGIEVAVKELGIISGQKAIVTRAKKSVANFKVREGMSIGAKVTLRGERMYYFVDKLFNIVLPRVRDFRGVSDKAFDGRGNYALGLKEQLIFPEINYDDVDKVRGMNVVFVTSAKSDEECKELLTQLGMPFAQG